MPVDTSKEKEIHVWSVVASADMCKVLMHDGYHFGYNNREGVLIFEAYDDYIEQLKERMRKAGYKIPIFKNCDF